jgi:formamidopyrimidine-DNA glycosylase
MPELPEVETIREYLTQVMLGQQLRTVKHIDGRMVKSGIPSGEEIARRLPGCVVKSIKRRGKFIFIAWDSGESLLVHLGMSGRLVWVVEDALWVPHTHLVLGFDGFDLRLSDPRRFGRLGLLEPGVTLGENLGVEPLGPGLTSRFLAEYLVGRTAPIKALLLDQRMVAGLGNIYADESLFRAGIRPDRPGGALALGEVKRLTRAIRYVLRESLAHRGTTFSDYVDALGHPGENQNYLMVYGRRDEACRRCGQPLVTRIVAGRTSHYCVHCQI